MNDKPIYYVLHKNGTFLNLDNEFDRNLWNAQIFSYDKEALALAIKYEAALITLLEAANIRYK